MTYESVLDRFVERFNFLVSIKGIQPKIVYKKLEFKVKEYDDVEPITHHKAYLSYKGQILYLQEFIGDEKQREIMFGNLLQDLMAFGIVNHPILKINEENIR